MKPESLHLLVPASNPYIQNTVLAAELIEPFNKEGMTANSIR